jgi:hypothetical protein
VKTLGANFVKFLSENLVIHKLEMSISYFSLAGLRIMLILLIDLAEMVVFGGYYGLGGLSVLLSVSTSLSSASARGALVPFYLPGGALPFKKKKFFIGNL